MASRGGRKPSGPWSRLKPVTQDPLDAYGLPSKGDTRLLDPKVQERYYTKIVDRYMAFCSDAGHGDELLQRMAQLDLKTPAGAGAGTGQGAGAGGGAGGQAAEIHHGGGSGNHGGGGGGGYGHLQRPATAPSVLVNDNTSTTAAGQADLALLMLALRKLREGLVASKRIDAFATQVYIFGIRLSVMARHMESYAPALLYLLRTLHAQRPLATAELHEFVGYWVLDLACRQDDLAGAYAVRQRYGLRDHRVDGVLRALAHDDYGAFWRLRRGVDGYRVKLMEWAEARVRTQALKAIARSYMAIDLPSLERLTGTSWQVLVAQHGVGWELQGAVVKVRKPKER